MPAILLHQWAISPFCGKVRRVLDHKGLAYEVENYNGLRGRKVAKLTPAGKLPVLDYDGERLQDSSDIAAFLDAKHPTPALYPADPVLRAKAHFWEDWADESLYWFEVYFRFEYDDARAKATDLLSEGRPPLERFLMARVLKGMHAKKLKAQGLGKQERAKVEARFFEHLDALNTLLGATKWLVGDSRSIADIAVASQLAEIARTSHLAAEIDEHSHVKAWLVRA